MANSAADAALRRQRALHCRRHRGATVAALMRSLLAAEPFADSVRYINGIRDVQIDKVLPESRRG